MIGYSFATYLKSDQVLSKKGFNTPKFIKLFYYLQQIIAVKDFQYSCSSTVYFHGVARSCEGYQAFLSKNKN